MTIIRKIRLNNRRLTKSHPNKKKICRLRRLPKLMRSRKRLSPKRRTKTSPNRIILSKSLPQLAPTTRMELLTSRNRNPLKMRKLMQILNNRQKNPRLRPQRTRQSRLASVRKPNPTLNNKKKKKHLSKINSKTMPNIEI